MQKAAVTRLVQVKEGAITLGIGDGANDVGMIEVGRWCIACIAARLGAHPHCFGPHTLCPIAVACRPHTLGAASAAARGGPRCWRLTMRSRSSGESGAVVGSVGKGGEGGHAGGGA